MLYSIRVLYNGCFEENFECFIVPVYNIAGLWVENQECFVIPVNKSVVYYLVFYSRWSGGKSKYL